MKKLRRISLAKISLREVENQLREVENQLREVENQLCEVEMDSWE